MEDMWFQQDSTSTHTSWAKISVLHENCKGRIFSLYDDIDWRPIVMCSYAIIFCGVFSGVASISTNRQRCGKQ